MNNSLNLGSNFENSYFFAVDDSLNQDVFSLNNNFTGSFQQPILNTSYEANSLISEENYTREMSARFNNFYNPQLQGNVNTNIINNSAFNVDETGKFTVDLLFHADGYTKEIPIFSLAGMEDLNPSSDEYIKEAARRALTNPTEGYIFQELGNSNSWDQTESGKHLIEFAGNNNSFAANYNPNAGKLEFEKAEFNTFELGIPTLSATIIRTDGSLGQVSATVHLTNGTAIANKDFDDTPIVVNFADGEMEKNITIPIKSDNLKEGRETLNLSLGHLSGGARLGEQNTAVVNIGDEDTSNLISSSHSDDSALSLDTVNVFLKPGEEISFDITVTALSNITTAENVNNSQISQINIFPVDDNFGYIKEISLKKTVGNNYTYTVKLLSDGTGGNQTITLRVEGYGDTTVNAIAGFHGPFNRPPNPQQPSVYLDPNILPVQGVITGGSEEGVLLNQEIENNKSIRRVGFREVNNPIDAQQTWVIVHGWNDTPDGRFTDLAREISITNKGSQPRGSAERILLLDWREAAYNNSEILGVEYGVPGEGNLRAATWITSVAEFALIALKNSYGIDSQVAAQSLNLIGHSLGSLVTAEMGRIYRDGMIVDKETIVTANNQGARTITALEPPSARNRDRNPFTEDPNQDIYDVDGRKKGIQAPEKFADVSVFSRAYVGEKSIAGNRGLTVTADEAFQMDFATEYDFVTDFGEEHGRVVTTFINIINQQGTLGDLLGIKAYESIDKLSIDDFDELRIRREDNGGYTGIIDVSKDDRASLLIAKSKTGKQDDIVIGSVVNQEIDGSDFFYLGGDNRYTGNGDDIFFGESGNDLIIGDDNNDILFGGIGQDTLNGGSGIDTFVLKPGGGNLFKQEADIIEDFQIGIDKIGLMQLNFEQLSFQEVPSGFFGISRDTAIVANSEIIALLKDIKVEEIQKPEFFVFIDEDELRVS